MSIFTKILKQEIQGHIVFEDNDFFAILDIHPRNAGHTLLIPKEEYKDLFEMPVELLQKVILKAKDLGKKIQNSLDADGVKIVQNNGESAGQTVMHFHMHIIPFYEDQNKSIRKDDFDTISKMLKTALA